MTPAMMNVLADALQLAEAPIKEMGGWERFFDFYGLNDDERRDFKAELHHLWLRVEAYSLARDHFDRHLGRGLEKAGTPPEGIAFMRRKYVEDALRDPEVMAEIKSLRQVQTPDPLV